MPPLQMLHLPTRIPLHRPGRIPHLQPPLHQASQLDPIHLLPRLQRRARGTKGIVRELDADAGIEDGIRDAPTEVGREVEIGDVLRAVHVRLVIAAGDAAAVFDAVGQALGIGRFGPAFVDDAVAEGVLAAFGPGADGGGGVVGVVVDVADFGVAFRIWGWG